MKLLLVLLAVLTLPLPEARAEAPEYDVIVVGGTPGGIAAAVAAARLGRRTALIEYHAHLGGMTASGLGKSDIETAGAIGGLWDEFVGRVKAYYVEKYGEDSPQAAACREGYFYEPSVAEHIFDTMVAEQPLIDAYRSHQLDGVTRRGKDIVSIDVIDRKDGTRRNFTGRIFADCTYEGDLAAWAGVPYRLGRESRAEHDEPHAGVIYMDHETRSLLPGSTGQGDGRLVAYTYRLCLSSDPENSIYPEKPANYDAERYRHYLLDLELGRLDSVVKALSIAPIPNNKYDANMKPWPLGFPFAEENREYPEGDWAARERVMQHVRDLTLGLVYWLQNDPRVPADQQADARRYGLAADEFTDNGNFPFQFYVREARRVVGEYTLTEHDLSYAPEQLRAPIHETAVSAGEFPIDSFPTRKYEPGHEEALEGYILMLKRYTQPYQIPYGVMVNRSVENLLFPVPASATHIAFSSVRLEPTWMSLGQAAGAAAHLALESACATAAVPVVRLQRMLADGNAVLTYFSDVKKSDPDFAAMQFWGTKGFFETYEAQPDAPLSGSTGLDWVQRFSKTAEVTPVAPAWPATAEAVSWEAFDAWRARQAQALGVTNAADKTGAGAVHRRDAAAAIYALLCQYLDRPVRGG